MSPGVSKVGKLNGLRGGRSQEKPAEVIKHLKYNIFYLHKMCERLSVIDDLIIEHFPFTVIPEGLDQCHEAS